MISQLVFCCAHLQATDMQDAVIHMPREYTEHTICKQVEALKYNVANLLCVYEFVVKVNDPDIP
jgi:hypothetical protein